MIHIRSYVALQVDTREQIITNTAAGSGDLYCLCLPVSKMENGGGMQLSLCGGGGLGHIMTGPATAPVEKGFAYPGL